MLVLGTASPWAFRDGPIRFASNLYSSSCAVLPMISAARSGSFTPGIWIAIWLVPCLRTSVSETPSLSIRSRMIEIERSRSSSVSSRPGGGWASRTISSPPWRSSPSFGFW